MPAPRAIASVLGRSFVLFGKRHHCYPVSELGLGWGAGKQYRFASALTARRAGRRGENRAVRAYARMGAQESAKTTESCRCLCADQGSALLLLQRLLERGSDVQDEHHRCFTDRRADAPGLRRTRLTRLVHAALNRLACWPHVPAGLGRRLAVSCPRIRDSGAGLLRFQARARHAWPQRTTDLWDGWRRWR